MTRRDVLISLSSAAALRAQAPYPGTRYRDYSRCLPDYLKSLAMAAHARREAELAKLTSPEAVKTRQKWARDTFWRLSGGIPERTPLNLRTLGGFERASYRVEKIVYESRPRFHIPALLYIPKNFMPPFPGVLFQMGHALNGKANASYQRCCQGLAQLGYLVLAFDPMGQGERVYYPDASGIRTRLGSADDEHTHPGKQMLLNGDSSTRMQTWDAVRSLDVLASHPLVDPKLLASTGQSGGGTTTMFLVAVDDRLAAAAVCSGNTENVVSAQFNPPGPIDDAEQNIVNSGPAAFDRWDMFYPFAPKPMFVSVSDKDWFGTYSPTYITNGWQEFQKLKRVYQMLGASEKLAWGHTPMPHGLAYDLRIHVYNWFGRWLRGDQKPVSAEPPTMLERDETLWVTKTGSVIREFGGETPFTLNRHAKPAPLMPYAAPRISGSAPTILRKIAWRGVRIEVLEFPSDPRVFLPAWLYLPESAPRDCLVVLQASNRLVNWREDELFEQLARHGHAVCVPDIRGAGDLGGAYPGGASAYARDIPREEAFAWVSLVLGCSLLVQRVTDILAVLGVSARLPGVQLKIAAQGKMCLPALLAAQQAKDVGPFYFSGPLASLRSLVETESYNYSFSNFHPGMLAHPDIPELIQAIAPRKVTLAGPVDGAARPVSVKAGPHVTVSSQARWDAESIGAI